MTPADMIVNADLGGQWTCGAVLDVCMKAPQTPGVYVFFGDGAAIYVGSSVHLRSRIRQHANTFLHEPATLRFITKWGEFDDMQIAYRQYEHGGLDDYEYRTYVRLCQFQNIQPPQSPTKTFGYIGRFTPISTLLRSADEAALYPWKLSG